MSSGFQKGTQIYYPFLSKSPGKQIPSSFPNGAPLERERAAYREFLHMYLYIYMSQRPKEKSISPCSSPAGPLWKQTSILEPYLTHLSGSSVKEPYLCFLLITGPYLHAEVA
jgi:hypothetical protein